ncbi:hypothetical protein HY637_02770 [Candidatus Woesearchaeota archaeon]|nr:hypothetical protein [Candidatus Woesearchaeota archaeon]
MIQNVYLTIFLIAMLMLLDYYLTMKGFKLYKQKTYKYIKLESYELNTMFKESVNQSTYNFKHLLSVALVSIFVYILYYASYNEILFFHKSTYHFIQGMIFSMFIYINSKHLQNIMTFNAVNRNPSILSGKIKQTTLFSLKSGIAHSFAAFLVLLSLFLLVPSFFTFGFAIGPLAITLKQRKWLKKK